MVAVGVGWWGSMAVVVVVVGGRWVGGKVASQCRYSPCDGADAEELG